MMRSDIEDERAHAARLVAILAQATPTHELLLRGQALEAATKMLLGHLAAAAAVEGPGSANEGGEAAVEHAASVIAVLAQNPDNHFGLVGQGLVPVLVQLLSLGVYCKLMISPKGRVGYS